MGVCAHMSMPSSHESVVHASLSPQARGPPAVHVPAWQVSPTVQKAPSSQVVPLLRLGWVHTPALHTSLVHALPSSVQLPLLRGVKTQPVAGEQVSVVHSMPSSHTSGVPGAQTPEALQASPTVHASLSVQVVPGVAGVFEQLSPPSLQASTVHGLASRQFGLPPVHTPP
jgi:hypothetical protein